MKIAGMRKFFSVVFLALSLATLNCATGKPRYQYQRTVPGADGTVYVQAIKVQPRILFSSTTPVILNCKLRGEDLKCDRELNLNIDTQYWQSPEYFQKDVKP
jgi:hypothetical protein